MSQLYARVFTQILDSSLASDWKARHVFEDFLKLHIEGMVDMTRDALSRRTNIPRDVIDAAIAVLESPDPNSRYPEEQGRRLIRLDEHRDWGWIIVNWEKYEKIRSREDDRLGSRDRMRKSRSKDKENTPIPLKETPKTDSHSDSEEVQQFVTERNIPQHCAETVGSPTLKEVQTWASFNGLAPWKAEDWWNEMEGCGWIDHLKRPIKSWQSILLRVRAKWESDGRPKGPPKPSGQITNRDGSKQLSASDAWDKELARIKA
jgi:hypothetical protein